MDKEQEDQLLLKLIIQALEKLDKTIEAIDKRTDSIDLTLARNTKSLEEHIRRTELIEEQLAEDLVPIKSAYDWVIISGKVIGVLALVVSIIGGLFQAIKFLFGF